MMIKKKKYKVWEFKDNSSQYLKQLKKRGFTRYDIKGHVIERVQLQPLNNKSAKNIGTKTTYQFKGNQLQEELHYTTVDHLHQHKKYQYNKNGQLVYCIYSYADGAPIHESFYEYDDQGRKTMWICQDYSMNDKSVYYYYYDRKNRLTETTLILAEITALSSTVNCYVSGEMAHFADFFNIHFLESFPIFFIPHIIPLSTCQCQPFFLNSLSNSTTDEHSVGLETNWISYPLGIERRTSKSFLRFCKSLKMRRIKALRDFCLSR